MTASSRRRADQLPREVQEDLYRLEAIRNQLTQMLQQHQVLIASRLDHLRAREALAGLDSAPDGSDVLLPLGGEAYIRGSPDRKGPVLLGIGSGIVVELERPKAAEILAQRLRQIEQAAGEMEDQMRVLEDRMTAISQRVEAMSASSGAAGGADLGDVGGD